MEQIICINNVGARGLEYNKVYDLIDIGPRNTVLIATDGFGMDVAYDIDRFYFMAYKVGSTIQAKFGGGSVLPCEIIDAIFNKDEHDVVYTIRIQNGMGINIKVNELDLHNFVVRGIKAQKKLPKSPHIVIKQPKHDFKYQIADIVDLTYRAYSDKMPNRIIIQGQSIINGAETYRVFSEKHGMAVQMYESEIRPCSKMKPVYSNPTVVKLYEQGYRFCGNLITINAIESKLVDILTYKETSSIRTEPALDPTGFNTTRGTAIWVRYKNPIEIKSLSV